MKLVKPSRPQARPESTARLVIESEAPVPTKHGTFRFVAFRHGDDWTKEHLAIVAGDVRDRDVLVRVHSECITSEVFGSLKCDCSAQLDGALSAIGRARHGVVVYLRQEGRSIGLANKLRAYALQACGVDTVDANRLLGLPDDARRYDAAAAILKQLGVRRCHVMTNNPAKLEALQELGVELAGRVPSLVESARESHDYLRTKRTRMRHLLP